MSASYRFDNHNVCKGCKAEITPRGGKMPFDLMPVGDSPAITHFSTCPMLRISGGHPVPELESLRSIARRLVLQYREKRELQTIARLVDTLPPPKDDYIPEPIIVPGFDFFITPDDIVFLHSLGVRP